MRLGVDANEANVVRRVGSNQYAFQVLRQLYRQGADFKWTIYLSRPPVDDLPCPKSNWQYRVLPPAWFWTQWRLPLDLFWHRPRPDVFLTLGHYAPRFSPVPTMVCIMDLAFLKFSQTFQKRDWWQLKSWTGYSVKKAAHIFAISGATKQDIINSYQVPAGKISVAYPGIDKLPVSGKSPVKGKYILYLGTLQPRKNIDALINAFKTFHSGVECPDIPEWKLAIAGKVGWKYKIKPNPGVKFLGYVPEEKLGVLIKNSRGLVLPSLYEGFGIPVVQAMSLKTPVLVSRNSSLPEIVGKAGFYIEPPFGISDIRAGLEKLLSLSFAQKQALVSAAKLRAGQFTWAKTAAVILKKMVE